MRLGFLVALVFFLAPLRAVAQPDDADLTPQDRARARRHFDGGVRAFEARDYRECVREFELALAIAGHPSVLKNLGRCHEELGEIHTAIGYYERYLNESPQAADRDQIDGRLRDLRARDTAQAPPPPEPEPQPAPAPAPEPPKEEAKPLPGFVPWVLVGAGVVGVGIGIGLIGIDGTCTSDSPVDADGDCRDLRATMTSGIVFLAGGVVVAGVGVFLLVTGSGDEAEAQAMVADPVLRF